VYVRDTALLSGCIAAGVHCELIELY